MQITTEIDFDLDLDDTMREIAEEVVDANHRDFMTWDDYHEGWHDQINEYAEAMEFVTASDLSESMQKFITLDDYNEYITDSMTEYLEESEYATMDSVRMVVDNLTYDTEGMVNKIASLERKIIRQHENDYMRVVRNVYDLDVCLSGTERMILTLKRDINILLEERERTLGRRARRLFTLTCSTLGRMVRRVHWHMPRR